MNQTLHKYCSSLSCYKRRESSTVEVGNITIGGDAPIVIQSMATIDTNKIEEATEQAKRIFKVGAKLVRFTAQGVQEAKNLRLIRENLTIQGIDLQLVADIHLNPAAAFEAVCHVEKVRINPGNFVDRRANFQQIEYTAEQYQEELDRLEYRFEEFLEKCKTFKRAIRIGVNHGSLSDRIMSRYGNTVEGMVESAMELLRVCKRLNFSDVVVSMKSSNTVTMVRAYRTLCAAMLHEQMNYPLHLGVTEAGEGADGRVRSSVGIGTLLNDGIGDTIRVSLTEEPEAEIPSAQLLVEHYDQRSVNIDAEFVDFSSYNPINPIRRGSDSPCVIFDISRVETPVDKLIEKYPNDYIYIGQRSSSLNDSRVIRLGDSRLFHISSLSQLDNLKEISDDRIIIVEGGSVQLNRAIAIHLHNHSIKNPIILKQSYEVSNIEKLQIVASADLGGVLIDGFFDGVWLDCSLEQCVEYLPLAILQPNLLHIKV